MVHLKRLGGERPGWTGVQLPVMPDLDKRLRHWQALLLLTWEMVTLQRVCGAEPYLKLCPSLPHLLGGLVLSGGEKLWGKL